MSSPLQKHEPKMMNKTRLYHDGSLTCLFVVIYLVFYCVVALFVSLLEHVFHIV